jgi:hypothetical protein
MKNNAESTELEVWYICTKLLDASDSEEIKKLLKKLEKITETMCIELNDLINFYKYYSLHYDAKNN